MSMLFLVDACSTSKESSTLRVNLDYWNQQAGPRITGAVSSPSKVQSFYVNPIPGTQGFEPEEKHTEILGWLGYYAILGNGKNLGDAQSNLLTDLLLHRSNYRIRESPADKKLCIFEPRHGLRFLSADNDTVEGLFCFQCSQLILQTWDEAERWGDDFDPMEGDLKRLFDQFLPPR
jgi:hypothetical protein